MLISVSESNVGTICLDSYVGRLVLELPDYGYTSSIMRLVKLPSVSCKNSSGTESEMVPEIVNPVTKKSLFFLNMDGLAEQGKPAEHRYAIWYESGGPFTTSPVCVLLIVTEHNEAEGRQLEVSLPELGASVFVSADFGALGKAHEF